MRQKRAKAYRKLMALYSMSSGFREPYQVLVDSLMCKTAMETKMDFPKQLGIVLQGTVKPMITQCCIHELYLQGREQQPATDLAKTFERRKCNHREPIAGDECLTSVIGDTNKHRYVVASQSQPLRSKLRAIPAVPLVHINRSVMVLEPPSDATLQAKIRAEEHGLHASTSDMALVCQRDSSELPKKKKKGPKAPNPLSVKKKKPKTAVPAPPVASLGGTGAPATTSSRKQSEPTNQLGQGPDEDKSTRSGEKRTRSEEEGGDDEGHVDGTANTTGGRKRKRRRKGVSAKDASEAEILETV